MSSWTPRLLMVLVLVLAPPAATTAGHPSRDPSPIPPPAAHIGEQVCVSAEVTGAVGQVCAHRDRFGATWALQLTDTEADGRPITAAIGLEVAQAPDGSATLANDLGAGTTLTENGSFSPRMGSALGDISITTCVAIELGPDRCRTSSAPLPQLEGRASPAQSARLEQLVFGEPLESFLATRARTERSGVDASFDWTSDGCSAGPFAELFADRLDAACLRHDFAYRNFGQLFYGPTDSVRRRADEQLAADAMALGQPNLAPGLREGLQRFGAPSFYGSDLVAVWSVPSSLIPWLRTDQARPAGS